MSQYLSACRAVLACFLVAILCAQDAPTPKMLNIEILEGEGIVNNVKQRVAREPIVEVTDENHKPVAGAAVTFLLPSNGASGVFPNGSNILTTVTGPDGKATASGIKANGAKGQYQIRVTASFKGVTATQTIAMSNIAAAAFGTTAIWLTVLLAAGAAAGAGYAISSSGGSTTTTTKPPATITPGTPTVAPPR